MGIISRFKDIMSANINALLDKAEDPEKMVDQYLRNLESDLGKVKAETAAVMADEAKAKRELDSCKQEVDKYQAYAEKALKAGNESDARAFLEKKQSVARKLETLQQNYDLATANATTHLRREETRLRLRQIRLRPCRSIIRYAIMCQIHQVQWQD